MGITRELYAFYTLGIQTAQSRSPIGTNIYSANWDLAVVLDACRVDALQEVSDEYDFLSDIGSRWSVGSTSKEWIDNTFTDRYSDEIANTAIVTANPFTDQLRQRPIDYLEYPQISDTWVRDLGLQNNLVADRTAIRDDFAFFDAVWEYESGDTNLHSTPQPLEVTKRAIWAGRNTNVSRQIVHYMQPHAPYFAAADKNGKLDKIHKKPFAALKNGSSREEVWSAYINNLRYVLDSVEDLLKNHTAETVLVTADHGELFGEWGLTGHSQGIPHPAVRKVPWAFTSAEETETIEGEQPPEKHINNSVEEHLEELGYI